MTGSTIPRRALGRLFHDLRVKSEKTQLSAGLEIEVSPQTIGRMEDGRIVKISTAQFKQLLDFYRADDAARNEALGLVVEAKAAKGDPRGGWWRAYRDVTAKHFDHYMSLEQSCTRLTSFQMTLPPGLLQAPSFRRSMITTAEPERSAVDVEREVEFAARRQSRVVAGDFEIVVVLSESVLRHRVGGHAVMADQLHYMVNMSRRPNISLRIVPHGAVGYLGLIVQSFTLFEFSPLRHSGLEEPPVVFVECYEGALFLEESGVIDRHRKALADTERVALSEDDSRDLVLDFAKEYEA